jgi:leader peptidase (prepilin peptidase)/N-methyltransferase
MEIHSGGFGMLILGGALGASLASFANVAADRLPAGRSLLGRSRCDGCRRRLRAFENVPIFAWLALRGRCRTCGERIPVRVVVVETVGLLAGVGSAALLLALVP